MNDNSKSIWEDPNLMAIGIEFRLNTGCEKTDLPQLTADCKQLKKEHPHCVAFTFDAPKA